MMVSKVLRTLEDKKFITRHEHPTDTRAKTIRFTPEGETVFRKALISIEQADVEFFAELGTNLPFFNSNLVKLIGANK